VVWGIGERFNLGKLIVPVFQTTAYMDSEFTQGFVAHAVEDWREASKRIAPVLPHLWRLGGSHAQRELFGQVYYSALSQAERSSNPKRLSLVGDRAFSGNSVCSLNARAS
jgi:hypothetical protein